MTNAFTMSRHVEKTNLLKDCLIERRDDLSLVFARTKHGAEKLMKHLVECGFKADSIHGNKSQGQRDRAIRAFKKRDIDILVATDVAARGIDIPGVSHVYNYNLPEVPENYVHRIGRTARAGAEGKAIAFCAPDEFHLLKQIEKLMSISISVASGDEPEGIPKKKTSSNNRSRRRNDRSTGRGRGADGQKGRRKDKNNKPNAETVANPKKFKNKQVNITEYEANEQRRKEVSNHKENGNNSGESRKNAKNGKAKRWKSKTAGGSANKRVVNQKSGVSRPFNRSNKNKKPARRRQGA